MKKRVFLQTFLITIMLLILTACSVQPQVALQVAKIPIVVTDGLGRMITLNSQPERIVSLAPSNTELLFEVGAGSQVIGRDEFSDFPIEAKDIPSIGGSMGDYNLEAITNLKPDLVLAAEINSPELVKSLETLGITVYYLPNPIDLDGLYTNLRTVAKLTGHDATQQIETLQKRVQTVEERIAKITEKPLVFYELDASEPAQPWTAGSGTFIDLLITKAGGVNIGGVLESSWAQISIEELLAQNPDIILLGDAAYGITPESVSQRAGWEGLKAVKNGAVFAFDDNTVSRPTSRLVDGLEELAEIIHPTK